MIKKPEFLICSIDSIIQFRINFVCLLKHELRILKDYFITTKKTLI